MQWSPKVNFKVVGAQIYFVGKASLAILRYNWLEREGEGELMEGRACAQSAGEAGVGEGR